MNTNTPSSERENERNFFMIERIEFNQGPPGADITFSDGKKVSTMGLSAFEIRKRVSEIVEFVLTGKGILAAKDAEIESLRGELKQSEERCQDKWNLMHRTLKTRLSAAEKVVAWLNYCIGEWKQEEDMWIEREKDYQLQLSKHRQKEGGA